MLFKERDHADMGYELMLTISELVLKNIVFPDVTAVAWVPFDMGQDRDPSSQACVMLSSTCWRGGDNEADEEAGDRSW
jgi:hypothetical protein